MRVSSLAGAALTMLPLFAAASAQSATLPAQRFGLTAGVNFSTVSGGEDNEDVSNRTGLLAGVSLVIPLTPTFSFQPEALFSMKGAKVSDAGVSGSVKINYLEIPFLARFDVPANGGTRPYFYAGPALSIKLSCTTEVHGGGISISGDCADDSGDAAKTFDYSGVVGGGVAFSVGGGRIFTIGARYTHGFADISNDGDSKNRTLSVLASFELPFPK